jgi:GGDEF domain-containing protein
MAIQGGQHSIGASIGVAIGDGQMSSHALQIAADSAMYRAKQAGGQQFAVAVAGDYQESIQTGS